MPSRAAAAKKFELAGAGERIRPDNAILTRYARAQAQ
jgi:hypothetical protein